MDKDKKEESTILLKSTSKVETLELQSLLFYGREMTQKEVVKFMTAGKGGTY